MSLIASCKANRVESWERLRVVLAELPRGTTAWALLHNLGAESHPQHRWNIADGREQASKEKGNLSFAMHIRAICVNFTYRHGNTVR